MMKYKTRKFYIHILAKNVKATYFVIFGQKIVWKLQVALT